MSNKFKDIDKKNRRYYFFDDMMNIKNVDLNKTKIDKSHIKIFLFIISNLWHLKILNTYKLTVEILYTLLSIK